ncbi:hypothetical protein NHX12_023962 [Muraenolepis orangiensis]|uniref:Uncharacterized protein n=1 Tax=Muraenolepis orangiensis TaxID=630683 RepID=A0A9Q0EM15_9TELE|nr:hypothetical protein NHX12_023962 [Muraenolepis orangiensis]
MRLPGLLTLAAALVVHAATEQQESSQSSRSEKTWRLWWTDLKFGHMRILARTKKNPTWSPSIDDEGSTRDEFYDDEDLFSGSGSGCK